jgi:hypothetical protein
MMNYLTPGATEVRRLTPVIANVISYVIPSMVPHSTKKVKCFL